MPATRRLILFIIIILLLLLLFIVVPSVSWSQTPPPNPWQEPARELAKKIVAITGPRQTVALTVRNLSSLSDSEVAAVRLALDAELSAAGLRLAAKPDAAPELRITLSENLQGLLWIAEIPRDDAREFLMLSVSRANSVANTQKPTLFALKADLFWEQESPILSLKFMDSPDAANRRLFVLEPLRVAIYKSQNADWSLEQAFDLPRKNPPARDPQGSLVISFDVTYAILEGEKCGIYYRENQKVTCRPTDQLLPRYRKALTNIADATSADFYHSSVSIGTNEKIIILLAGTDGVSRLYDDSPDPVAEFRDWGSHLASLQSGCGTGTQLLVTRKGDWTEPDTITAVELVNRQAVAISSPLNVPGPVTELLAGSAENTAIAVVRNLKTGRYEAYTLTLSCGR